MAKPRKAATKSIKICTIGSNKKPAEKFFGKLQRAGVRTVIDVRLSNDNHLAGFTRETHLTYFLREIAGIGYVHNTDLAPTKKLHEARRAGLEWKEYKKRFMQLLRQRRPEKTLSRDDFDGACLLCAEPTADECHRRLVAEYLKAKWGNIEIVHL